MNERDFDSNMISGGKMGTPTDRDANSMEESPSAPEDSTENRKYL